MYWLVELLAAVCVGKLEGEDKMSKCHLMKRKVRRRLISRNSKLLNRWKYGYS
jgi:hypothetical protein